ncbi:hypothetical protein LMG7053_06119 [Achromobacter ruhlandii]|uniref:Uncharacterized protein n=1 Tax=Achromobacter ruhlandii TaxID=72557 RepID=A0ABM8M4G4_9BURK|nr:hypothetical protein Axylo_2956 [Achromobacter xylosoxidans]CAB3960056.1 hypothetical protein LMG7053_06119 [Achromobacter ruhlandii]
MHAPPIRHGTGATRRAVRVGKAGIGKGPGRGSGAAGAGWPCPGFTQDSAENSADPASSGASSRVSTTSVVVHNDLGVVEGAAIIERHQGKHQEQITGRKERPPRSAAARVAGPQGGVFALGRPGGKGGPRAPPLRGSLPPRGAFLPWGGPAEREAPTLRRCAGRCPPRGRFCLGAARRQGRPPRSAAVRVAAPQGGVLPWGGPAAKNRPANTLAGRAAFSAGRRSTGPGLRPRCRSGAARRRASRPRRRSGANHSGRR